LEDQLKQLQDMDANGEWYQKIKELKDVVNSIDNAKI